MLRTVLHVDDDAEIRELTMLSLGEIGGLDVRQCNSGEAAIETARSELPDLVLLDVMMPGLSGEETFDRFRETPDLANVPIVFMTAKDSPAYRQTLIEKGALGVVRKPFDPITLVDELNTIWEGRGTA